MGCHMENYQWLWFPLYSVMDFLPHLLSPQWPTQHWWDLFSHWATHKVKPLTTAQCSVVVVTVQVSWLAAFHIALSSLSTILLSQSTWHWCSFLLMQPPTLAWNPCLHYQCAKHLQRWPSLLLVSCHGLIAKFLGEASWLGRTLVPG